MPLLTYFMGKTFSVLCHSMWKFLDQISEAVKNLIFSIDSRHKTKVIKHKILHHSISKHRLNITEAALQCQYIPNLVLHLIPGDHCTVARTSSRKKNREIMVAE
jgi:hypothetical protein